MVRYRAHGWQAPLIVAACAALLLIVLGGAGHLLRPGATGAGRAAASPADATGPGPEGVLTRRGYEQLTIGATVDELLARGAVRAEPSACGGYVATASPSVRPVFADGRLVLVWADPPVRTAEGIGVGSTTDQVRQAYPDVRTLPPPNRPGAFPGMLAPEHHRTYLFLYDGDQVQKVLAGYTADAERLYSGALSPC